MGIIKTIKGWIYKIKHFDALEKQCKMLKSELNDVIRLNYNASMHRMLQVDCGDEWYTEAQKTFKEHGYNLTGMELWNPKVMYLENPTVNVFEDIEAHVPSTFIALKREMGINGLFLASVYSPKYTNAAEHPIDHLHSVLCDFDFNIVFDPQPEYAKVVNYPYSKLIGYNGIRSIDIIRKL